MSTLMSYAATALSVIGGLVIIVVLITQLTKNLPGIKKIPTELYAILLSEVVTIASVCAYCSWQGIEMQWYMVFGTVIGGICVAYVASYGWDSFNNIVNRYKK